MADLFLLSIESIISNYADDNNPFMCTRDDTTVIEKLTSDAQILLDWFITNGFKANPDKFHLLASTFDREAFIQIDQYKIHKSQCEKLLGIKIDHKLSFAEHVTTLCTKASQKLHALSRVSFFMSQSQRRLIMKAFINSHFGYCPLVWMFHSRKLNNRINNIHERALRLVYNDYTSSFQNLLDKDDSVSIHIRNIHTLAIELFKVANFMSPEIMKHILPMRQSIRYHSKCLF